MEFSSLLEMVQAFSAEEKCREHLTKMRWPNGVVCPKCGGYERISKLKSRPLWWCGDCKRQFSVKVGTIFEGSPIPLQKWFMAIWLLTSHKKGISSHQLKRAIGVTQKTAWFMLSRLREVMPKPGGGGLFGVVEIDDTYIGGDEKNKHVSKRTKGTQGRGSGKTKSVVLGIQGRGREIRAYRVPDLEGSTVRVVVSENVIPGSRIISDEFRTYKIFANEGYTRNSINHSAGEHVRGGAHTNSIENAWSLFKRYRRHLSQYQRQAFTALSR